MTVRTRTKRPTPPPATPRRRSTSPPATPGRRHVDPRPMHLKLYPLELYPESDDEPMGETPEHRDILAETIARLKEHFAAIGRQAMVSGDNFVYYEQSQPTQRVSPDLYVVLDHEPAEPRRYFIWEEGRAPDFVLEFTSPSTRRVDLISKRQLYRRLGVGEYFLFDPLREYLKPPLQGYRLVGGRYRPISPDRFGRLRSARLEISLAVEDGDLELYDTAMQARILRARERAEVEGLRAEVAEQRAESAEQRAEDARQQAEDARQQAEDARQLAQTAQELAEAQRLRAERLEAELRALRERLTRRDPM